MLLHLGVHTPWCKCEDFDVWRRAKGGDQLQKFFEVGEIMEFPDPVYERPEPCEAIEVIMIDENGEQLAACVRKDHIEEWGRRFPEVNDGP